MIHHHHVTPANAGVSSGSGTRCILETAAFAGVTEFWRA